MTRGSGSVVLLNKKTRRSKGYVEVFPDGRVKAGYWQDTARTYGTADEAHAHFRQVYSHNPTPDAWDIAYVLEQFIEQRDDGL